MSLQSHALGGALQPAVELWAAAVQQLGIWSESVCCAVHAGTAHQRNARALALVLRQEAPEPAGLRRWPAAHEQWIGSRKQGVRRTSEWATDGCR